jgi:hypothetical protein
MTADFVEVGKEKWRASPAIFPSPFPETESVIPNEVRNLILSMKQTFQYLPHTFLKTLELQRL